MTQLPRTTESINRDHAAIREIMHSIRALTVPDRATLAVGLIGHLATLMNGRQMAKLLSELEEEASKVQDGPPSRQRGERADARNSEASQDGAMLASAQHEGVGQAGRGEFRSKDLL